MKKLMLIALLLWGIGNLHAQPKTVEKTLPVPASRKVNLHFKFANDIKVTAWDKKEAHVKVTYEINGGQANQAFLLTFPEGQDELKVLATLDEEFLKAHKQTADCPEGNTKTMGYYGKGQPGQFVCTRLDYEVFLPRDTHLTLETINGNIELRGFTGPVRAKSISGFVDMDWPTQQGASVALKTITGEVFSDLTIQFPDRKRETPAIGASLKGNVQNGGSAITLESISNNIYFRQKRK